MNETLSYLPKVIGHLNEQIFNYFQTASPWGRAVKFYKGAEHQNICSKFYSDLLRCSAPKPYNISVRCTLRTVLLWLLQIFRGAAACKI